MRANLLKGGVGRPSFRIGYPILTAGDLNVTNPRYAAKYGNLYLRECLAMCDPDFKPTQLIQSCPSLLIIGSHSTSPRANGSADTYHAQVPKFPTMPDNSPRISPSNTPYQSEQTFNGLVPINYIEAQGMLNNWRLAMHV